MLLLLRVLQAPALTGEGASRIDRPTGASASRMGKKVCDSSMSAAEKSMWQAVSRAMASPLKTHKRKDAAPANLGPGKVYGEWIPVPGADKFASSDVQHYQSTTRTPLEHH